MKPVNPFSNLNYQQRKVWADRLLELANLQVIILVFTELSSRGTIRLHVVLFGVIIWILLTASGVNLLRGGDAK